MCIYPFRFYPLPAETNASKTWYVVVVGIITSPITQCQGRVVMDIIAPIATRRSELEVYAYLLSVLICYLVLGPFQDILQSLNTKKIQVPFVSLHDEHFM